MKSRWMGGRKISEVKKKAGRRGDRHELTKGGRKEVWNKVTGNKKKKRNIFFQKGRDG